MQLDVRAEELPKNANGKLMKNVLREELRGDPKAVS